MKFYTFDIVKRALFTLILVPVLIVNIGAKSAKNSFQDEPVKVFSQMESAINSGDISSISRFISSQTYISLSNGETGYFSSSQAYYIVQDFFKNYKVISFKFRSVNDADNPYGIGSLVYEFRNRRVTAQVFVSLTKSGNNWLISQFTVK